MHHNRPVSVLLPEAADASGRGAWLEAAACYAEVLAVEPSAPIFVQYGHMLKEGGLLEDAACAYRAALDYDGTDTDARLHLAHLLKRLGRPDEALTVFQQLAGCPNGPHVAPEIAALKVELAVSQGGRLQQQPAARAQPEAPPTLKDANARAMARRRMDALIFRQKAEQAQESLPRRGFRWRAFAPRAVEIPVRLEPEAHLVIEDGHLKATTNNPRFRLHFTDPGCASDLGDAWIDFSLNVEAAGRIVDPVLFVEHAPGWADFTAVRLRSEGDGSFRAVLRCRHPVLSLRLDPLHSSGQFSAGSARLIRLSWTGVLARTFAMAPRGTASALLAGGWSEKKKALADRLQALHAAKPPDDYQRWITLNARFPVPTGDERAAALSCGLLLDASQADLDAIEATVVSLRDQSHENWRLCAAVSRATPRKVRAFLEAEAARDYRISIIRLSEKLSLAARLMAASKSLATQLLARLAPGDRLLKGALVAFASAFASVPAPRVVYCDDDLIEPDGRRHSPRFKPDWNRDYILCYDYIGRTAVFCAEAFSAAGGYRDRFPGAEDYDLLLRLTAGADEKEIRHIPYPLWHRGGKESSGDIRGVVAEAIAANGSGASIEPGIAAATLRIVRPIPSPAPHVSIIIPTRDRADLLKRSVGSVLKRTRYQSFNIIVVDNGSVEDETLAYFEELRATGRVSVLSDPRPFNYSRLNNLAAATARGEILALVNNDIEVIDEAWLSEMVAIAAQPDIGAVGAKLLYSDGSVQHAGVVGGVGTVTAHSHKHFPGDASGYMNRLMVEQTVLAVTGACLVVGAEKYRLAGGLDEENLAIAFNDVDLCLKLAEKGYRTVFTPWARLYHHESASRGLDVTKKKAERFAREAAFMTAKWKERVLIDRFYNPHLTRRYEDFALAVVDED